MHDSPQSIYKGQLNTLLVAMGYSRHCTGKRLKVFRIKKEAIIGNILMITLTGINPMGGDHPRYSGSSSETPSNDHLSFSWGESDR